MRKLLDLDIDKLMHQAIKEVADIFKKDCKADIHIENHSAIVFIKFTTEVTCPFGFRLNIYADEDSNVNIIPSMFLVRSFASGDKTDIYVLFASCMGIIQKMIFGENIYIDYLHLFEGFEINSASLLFSDKIEVFKCDKTDLLKKYVKQVFSHFIMSLIINANYFGSFSNKMKKNLMTSIILIFAQITTFIIVKREQNTNIMRILSAELLYFALITTIMKEFVSTT